MFQKKQKPFIIFTAFLFLFLCFSFVSALEIDYPGAGGGNLTEETTFPQYIGYLFNFSIAMAGIIALGVIIWAGIKILTSPDQPATVQDARTKITGALLGIIILLSSYLILTTINPSLKFLGLQDIKPTSGVYLTDDKGKDHYIADSTPDVGFNPTAVKFISSPEELIAVYDLNENKIDNTGVNSGGNFSGKSIYFLWNRSGVYFYPEANFLGKPLFLTSSANSLANYSFDKKTKSIRFINATGTYYGSAFFSESDFRGTCGFVTNEEEIANIETGFGNFYSHPIKGGLSSFRLFNVSNDDLGEVIFYDSPNCTGREHREAITKGTTSIYSDNLATVRYNDNTPLKDHILSFKINGNVGVLLAQKENLGGKCQFFTKPSGDNCWPSIESSSLQGELWPGTEYSIWGILVGSFGLFHVAE